MEHAKLYRNHMLIKGVDNKVMCRIFPYTFTGLAKLWFRSLKAGSVSFLDQLLTEFIHEFGYVVSHNHATSKLPFIKQGESEPLADYVARFHQEVLRTGMFGHHHTLTYFEKNMRLEKLWCSFQKHRPLSYEEAYSRALQQIEMDEKCHLKWQKDKVEVMKNREKPKKDEVP